MNQLYARTGFMARPVLWAVLIPCRIQHMASKRSPDRRPRRHASRASSHHPTWELTIASTANFLPRYGDSSRFLRRRASEGAGRNLQHRCKTGLNLHSNRLLRSRQTTA